MQIRYKSCVRSNYMIYLSIYICMAASHKRKLILILKYRIQMRDIIYMDYTNHLMCKCVPDHNIVIRFCSIVQLFAHELLNRNIQRQCDYELQYFSTHGQTLVPPWHFYGSKTSNKFSAERRRQQNASTLRRIESTPYRVQLCWNYVRVYCNQHSADASSRFPGIIKCTILPICMSSGNRNSH